MRSYSCSTRWPRPGAGGALWWMRRRAWIEAFAPARTLLEAGEPLLVEALAPHRDDLAARVQARGDLVVAEPLGGQEHDLSADHIPIRQRIPTRSFLEDASLLAAQVDPIRAPSGHL